MDDPFIGPDRTIAEAKQWLRERLERGASCPCCTQLAKVYTRALASSLTAALVALYRLSKGESFHHVNEILARAHLKASVGREFSIVRYWGLTSEMEKEDAEDKRTSGYWKITEKGIDFVLRRITVPSHVRLYDSRRLGFVGKDVDVITCLKKKFSYDELMLGFDDA